HLRSSQRHVRQRLQQQLRCFPLGRSVAVRLQRPLSVRSRGNAAQQVTLISEEGFMVSPASRLLSIAVLAALVFGAPRMALAQNGRIRGTVRDASGDALSGVTIRAQGTAGAAHRATTGTDGSYTIANLTPGTYVVSASLPG